MGSARERVWGLVRAWAQGWAMVTVWALAQVQVPEKGPVMACLG